MDGMRIGGIDPSIVRELSGVYKPFVKAFKELISNAFDADADAVTVQFTDDFSSVTIVDDGGGMTPFEFRNDFTRIGGGSRRWTGDVTKKGRPRIGSKGIGFLAMARYCERLMVESSGERTFSANFCLKKPASTLQIEAITGIKIGPEILKGRVTLVAAKSKQRLKKRTLSGDELKWRGSVIRLSKPLASGNYAIKIRCKGLRFKAILDFQKLLRLADNADLEHLEDFATIEVADVESKLGTQITADALKSFVRRELRADRRKGFVRNVGSRSGYDQFLWNLSRCTPISYGVTAKTPNSELHALLKDKATTALRQLDVHHGKRHDTLSRPAFPFESESVSVPNDMLIRVRIDEKDLKASGFIASYETVIFPAEYRGISIRVRGVSIGEPGFLGAEALLTGAQRAALSQITGEINVTEGLDAVDSLNPGRESFYEESEHYKVLRRQLLGEGERVAGYIGQATAAVLRRSQVQSSLADIWGRASSRRKALEDISSAISHLISRGDHVAKALKSMLKGKVSHVNGLASAHDYPFGMPTKIGGLSTVMAKNQNQPTIIDYEASQVRLDTGRPEWQWSIVLFDRVFKVVHKRGQPEQPIGELDLQKNEILVNWGHPIKQQMEEHAFLRTALAFVLSKEAAAKDPGLMMDLTLRLLSFTSSVDG
jgi:hypothetical protein